MCMFVCVCGGGAGCRVWGVDVDEGCRLLLGMLAVDRRVIGAGEGGEMGHMNAWGSGQGRTYGAGCACGACGAWRGVTHDEADI